MAGDDLDASAALYAFLSSPVGPAQPEPERGRLGDLLVSALRLPCHDRLSARIRLDRGGSIGWTQIHALAERNGILPAV